MFNKKRKFGNIICSMVLALAAVFIVQMDVKAASVDGVSYDDKVTVNVQYASEWAKGGGSNCYIYLDDTTEHIANVKSNSKNLLAKKTYESYSSYKCKMKEYDWDTYTYQNKEEEEYNIYGTYISFFAKKAGKYKVTFDVVKADGTVRCTKTINVSTYAGSVGKSPVKSVKYAGKDLYLHYPYATKTSGVLSVKFNKGYKLKYIEIGTLDKKGVMKYKKVKNNHKITLAKSAKYVYDNNYDKTEHNALFPETYIRITYQNTKTKAVDTYSTYLYTLNKK